MSRLGSFNRWVARMAIFSATAKERGWSVQAGEHFGVESIRTRNVVWYREEVNFEK